MPPRPSRCGGDGSIASVPCATVSLPCQQWCVWCGGAEYGHHVCRLRGSRRRAAAPTWGSVRVHLQVSPRHTILILCVRCMLSHIVQLPVYHANASASCKQPAGPLSSPNRTGASQAQRGPCPSPGRTAGWTTRCGRRLCAFCDTLGNPSRAGSPDSPRVIIKSLHLEVVVFGRSSTSASKIMTVGSQCATSSRYHLACSFTPLACPISHARRLAFEGARQGGGG